MAISYKICTVFRIFQFPEFYYFPPFFTIQPIESTREKQLNLWNELILNYYTHHKLPTLIVHECPLFQNASIERKLSSEDIQVIMEHFIQCGNGEWDDTDSNTNTKTRCKIYWRKPTQLASDIYEWAKLNGHVGNGGVCTVYELHSGEDLQGVSFNGIDEDILRTALSILEEQGKCTIFQGDTSSEDGIKFF